MFGSSKNKKPSGGGNNGKPPVEDEYTDEPIPDINFKEIDKLLNTEINEDDVELTDADLEDPELLSQLSQIESGETLKKPEPLKKQSLQQQQTTTSTITTTIKTQVIPKPLPKPVKTEEDELKDLMDFDDDNNNNSNNKDSNNQTDYIDHVRLSNQYCL